MVAFFLPILFNSSFWLLGDLVELGLGIATILWWIQFETSKLKSEAQSIQASIRDMQVIVAAHKIDSII